MLDIVEVDALNYLKSQPTLDGSEFIDQLNGYGKEFMNELEKGLHKKTITF